MKTKPSLFTITHTGTHFAIAFLELLGIPHNSGRGYTHMHAAPELSPQMKERYEQFLGTKCVTTARDPILTGLRYIHNGTPVSQIAGCWNVFLDVIPDLDYFVLDVGCREKDRLQHMCDLAEFVGKGPSEYMDKIISYVDSWKPLNVSESFNKQQYLRFGRLPKAQVLKRGSKLVPRRETVETTLTKEIDWKAFDRAVDWYKSLPTNDFGDK